MRPSNPVGSLRTRLVSTWLRIEPIAVWVVYVEWAFWIGLLVSQVLSAVYADSTADWLVASAAREGRDPFLDLRELSRLSAVPYITPGWNEVGDAAWIHPRTPGALLLLQPVTALTPDALHGVTIISSLVALAAMGISFLSRFMGVRWELGLLFAALLIISGPVLRSMQFGAWSVFIALLTCAAWLLARKEDNWLSGIFLGVAVGIRLFPGLMIVPMLLYRRWKVSSTAVAVSVGVNLIGMLALGLSPTDVVRGLERAEGTWLQLGGNASLVKPISQLVDAPSALIVVVLATAAAVYIWYLRQRGKHFDHAMAFIIVAMLLISPLSWEHYDVILFAVIALFLAANKVRVLRISAVVWLVGMTLGFVLRQPWEQAQDLSAGLPSLLGRLLILVALVLATEMESRESSTLGASPVAPTQVS